MESTDICRYRSASMQKGPRETRIRSFWSLDSDITYLNHGSYGACPTHILKERQRLQLLLENEPFQFFESFYRPALDKTRSALSSFVGAAPGNLVFVHNATSGINAVLRSISFGQKIKRGGEILITDHEYNATRNVVEYVAKKRGLRVQIANIPFPIKEQQEVLDAIVSRINTKTELIIVDHITSQTALILPIQEIAKIANSKEIPILVDGAHGPGMLPLELENMGITYYTGNCHKWMCAPRGSAFLYVHPSKQSEIKATVISHGENMSRGRNPFHEKFDWTGTNDPTAWLVIDSAFQWLDSIIEGGWPEIRAKNKALVVKGRDLLLELFDASAPAPSNMLPFMASIPLPSSTKLLTLQNKLFSHYKIEVPIIPWPAGTGEGHVLRISAHLYNQYSEYERLTTALKHLLSL